MDNHNNNWVYPIYLEDQGKTKMWGNCVLLFTLAGTKVNCNFVNADSYGEYLIEHIEFRFNLGDEVMNNPYISGAYNYPTGKMNIDTVTLDHILVSMTPYRTCQRSTIRNFKMKYIQLLLSSNKKINGFHLLQALSRVSEMQWTVSLTFIGCNKLKFN